MITPRYIFTIEGCHFCLYQRTPNERFLDIKIRSYSDPKFGPSDFVPKTDGLRISYRTSDRRSYGLVSDRTSDGKSGTNRIQLWLLGGVGSV